MLKYSTLKVINNQLLMIFRLHFRQIGVGAV